MYERQFGADGFEWINYSDHYNAVVSFVRRGVREKDHLVVVCNMTPVVREQYRIGVPSKSRLREIFNSDEVRFGGSGVLNPLPIKPDEIPWNDKPQSISLTLPPLGITVLKP